MVRVHYFPKPCPTCGGPLRVYRVVGGPWWYECRACQTEPL